MLSSGETRKLKFILFFCVVGKTKCMSKGGDCVVKHGTTFTTGFGMVVSVFLFFLKNFQLKYQPF